MTCYETLTRTEICNELYFFLYPFFKIKNVQTHIHILVIAKMKTFYIDTAS